MAQRTKHKFAKVLTVLVSATMTASLCMTSLAAFAKTDLSADRKFTNKYSSFADALKASGELNEQIAAEGIVMLKNNTAGGGAPLAKGEKVTVLGKYSLSPSYGGAGSGSVKRPGRNDADRTYVSENATDFYTGLEAGGLVTNQAVKGVYSALGRFSYEDGKYMQLVTDGEGEVSFAGKQYNSLTSGGTLQDVNNYGEYSTAIVTITRTGSEFYDNAAYNVAGHSDTTDHYLELNDSERELMAYAKKNFNKVIVLLNGPSALEVGDLKNDDGIDAVYWVGQPGWNGFNVLGDVLTGEINPSGKLVDEWFTKFEYDPTWYNWGSYGQAEILLTGSTERESGTRSSTTIDMGLPTSSGLSTTDQDHVMDYAEGIYLGYRYAETVYEALAKTDKEAADAWFEQTISYPFGYGLSYTSFTKKILEITGDLTDEDGKITVKVEVQNTGTVAGKEVVQIYSSAPYTDGGIEKAACDLVGFTKTDIIKPGEKQTVEVEVAVKDLAAFDYNDANKNNNFGYELEAGSYVISVRDDSHTVADSKTLTADSTLTGWDEDGDASTPNNIFTQSGNNWEMYNTLAYNWTVSGDNHYMTRGTTDEDSTNLSLTEFATAATDIIGTDADKKEEAQAQLAKLSWLLTEENLFTDEAINSRHQQYGATNDPYHDMDNALTEELENNYENVWVKEYSDLPAGWTQATTVGDNRIQAYTLLGEPMYLEDGTENPKWTEFMNQFTYEELAVHGQSGSFSTPAVESVGLPRTSDADGPAQMSSGWTWVCEVVIASTWNLDLAYQQGQQNGYESMLQNVNGWYGPAANNHRNPLSGRNFEYYSQDGVHGGLIAASVIKGATDLGVHVYLKHAFLNDQETQRYGMATFATEQAIRLIYSKPWEMAIRYGNLNGTMSAFNNVGNASSSSYAVMIQLYENEWGFDGYSVTDMYGGEGGSYLNMWSASQMARGHNMPLGSVLSSGKPNKDSGVWSTTANGGKGGVMIKGTPTSSTEDTESPTQWYWVRTTAMHMMYTQVNNNAMKNGLSSSMIGLDGGIKAVTGAVMTPVSVADTAALNEVFGGSDKYVVTVTGLPAGLTCSEAGVISGTPTEGMVGTVTVTVTGKDTQSWMTVSETVDIVVSVRKVVTTITSANIETEAAIELTEDNYVPGGEVNQANANKYIDHKWSIEGELPEGLTFDTATGIISGTATDKGSFDVTVTETYTQVVRQGWWGNNYTTRTTTYVTKYAISVVDEWAVIDGHLYHLGEDLGVVQGPAGPAGTPGADGQDGQDGADGIGIVSATVNEEGHLIITLSNGSTLDAGMVRGPAGPAGPAGADGADGQDGQDSTGGSGCRSAIGMDSIIAIASAFALIGVVLVVKKAISRKDR